MRNLIQNLEKPDGEIHSYEITDWNGDHKPDLAIFSLREILQPLPITALEIRILDGSDNFQTVLLKESIIRGAIKNPEFMHVLIERDSELVIVRQFGTASGFMELDRYEFARDTQEFVLRGTTQLPIPEDDNRWGFDTKNLLFWDTQPYRTVYGFSWEPEDQENVKIVVTDSRDNYQTAMSYEFPMASESAMLLGKQFFIGESDTLFSPEVIFFWRQFRQLKVTAVARLGNSPAKQYPTITNYDQDNLHFAGGTDISRVWYFATVKRGSDEDKLEVVVYK